MTLTDNPTPSAGRDHITQPRRVLTGAAVLASGLSAGFFLTYAISVTRGLAVVDDLTYVTTFQAVNATVRTGWFAAFFFGTLPLLAIAAYRVGPGRRRGALVAATTAYAVGVLGVTFVGAVPMNNELAGHTDLATADLAAIRSGFEDSWNGLNLVRTLVAGCVFATAVWTHSAGPGRSERTRQRNRTTLV